MGEEVTEGGKTFLIFGPWQSVMNFPMFVLQIWGPRRAMALVPSL